MAISIAVENAVDSAVRATTLAPGAPPDSPAGYRMDTLVDSPENPGMQIRKFIPLGTNHQAEVRYLMPIPVVRPDRSVSVRMINIPASTDEQAMLLAPEIRRQAIAQAALESRLIVPPGALPRAPVN